MTRYAIFGKGRTVPLYKGQYCWLARDPIFGGFAGADGVRYGYSGWGFQISDTSHLEMNDACDADHLTSILPWEV